MSYDDEVIDLGEWLLLDLVPFAYTLYRTFCDEVQQRSDIKLESVQGRFENYSGEMRFPIQEERVVLSHPLHTVGPMRHDTIFTWHHDGGPVNEYSGFYLIVWTNIIPTLVRDVQTKVEIPTQPNHIYLFRNNLFEHCKVPLDMHTASRRYFARWWAVKA